VTPASSKQLHPLDQPAPLATLPNNEYSPDDHYNSAAHRMYLKMTAGQPQLMDTSKFQLFGEDVSDVAEFQLNKNDSM